MHHVSRRRGRQTEYQASIKKFLDRGKDSIKRLKALKFGLEKSSAKEVKEFYTEHSTDVFYVVYGSFTTLETTIHDKLAKGKGYSDVLCKELVELVLPVFQQVLVSLPELIHQKWQFNSICLVIRKLLHPGNHMKLRQYGMQLLVLWVQGLQENAGDACMEQFASVIPHFPPQKTPMGMPQAVPSLPGGPSGLGERYGVYNMPSSNQRVLNHWGTSQGAYPSHLHRSSSAILLGSNSSPSSREVVCSNVLVPLVPRSADQPNASEAEQLMVCLLEILTQHTRWLHWDDPAQHVRGFAHLFFLFKLFYLACLYKDFRSDAALYTPPTPPVTEVIVTRASPADTLDSLMEEGSSDTDAAEATPPVADSSSPKYKRKRGNPYRMSSVIKLEYDLSNPVYEKVKKLILLYILRWFLPSGKELLKGVARECEVYLLPSPVIHQEVGTSGVELMKHMWYTSRDNVSLLLEICRQGFTTLSKPSHMRLLVDLYWHWSQVLVKPTFMREPPLGTAPEPVKVVEEREPSAAAAAGGSEEDLLPVIHSWEQLSNYEGFKTEHVQAGMAASLCMLIAHTQQIFVLESWTDLSVQIELCRKVIRLYQDIAVSWLLDKGGWEYLLSVLLHHTWTLLTAKDNTLACALANSILKTLLICFLRVSMVMDVSPALWDQLLQVLHSLTHWKEVVMQWKLAMESMTEVLARAVYGLDLNELPLDSCDRTRPRTVSVGRQQHPASQHEIAPPKLSNFSAILDGPPANTTGQRRREQSQVTVERGKKSVDSLRGTLQRAATQDAHDSPPMVEVPIEKRHSTPSTCNKHVGPLIIMPAISEDFTSRKSSSGSRLDEISPSPTSPESVSMVTPYQPLINEDERTTQLIEGVEEEEGQGGGAGEVIVNLNTTSPTLSQEELLHPSSNNATPPLENTSPETRHGSLPLSTGLFKHHSPDPKHRSPDPKHRSPDPKHRSPEVKRSPDVKHKKGREFMLATQPLMEDGGKSRWKKKWLPGHKRYGSDVTAQIRTADLKMLAAASSVERQESPLVSAPGLGKESSPASHSQGKGSEVSVDSTTTREHKPVLYKSASDGNLHLLLLGSHTLPKLSPPQLRDDSALHVRRISSGGSTHVSTSASTREGCVAPASSSTGAVPVAPHRPLRRSLTIDSPEPTSAGAETAAANAVHFFDPASLTVPTDTPPHAGSGGWSCKVAAVVWLRMLKVLGNVNDIQQPAAHAEAMAGLYQIWSSLKNIRANSGISLNSSATPPLPAFMPPLTLLLPWIIETCSLPPSHSRGREIAHQLLCEIMVTHWHTPPSLQHVTHFYHLLHVAMQPSADMCAVAVRHGCQLFSHGLAGSSVLLQDCVSACGALLASPNSVSPHNEALYMLGSLLYLPDLYSDYPLPVLVEEGSEEKREGLQGGELKERIVNILFLAATRESSRISRCIALYLVGTLVFSELYLERPSQRLPVGVDILLASLQFADRGVAMAAIDMMSLLSEVAPQMFKLYPSLPLKVLQAICYAIAVFLTEELEQASWVDKVLVTLLLLLRDWVMAIPLHTLVQDPAAQGAIRTVFEVLQAAAGSQQVTAKRHAISQLFTIQSPVDIELSQLVTSSNRHSHAASSEHQTLTRSSERKDVQLSAERLKNSKQQNQVDDGKIQTAARSVLTHLLNLLGHFPFGCGAAQLSSTVKEHHDSPSLLHLEEMSTEVFDSPRLQFFALDNTAVVTLLEVPTMLNGVPEGVSAGPYQSRVIVRDVTGKYTWDSTLLYGPQHIPEDTCSLTSASSLDSLEDSIGASSEGGTGPPDFVAPRIALVQPPSWRTHANSDRDVLQDLLEHVTVTSPECILDTSCSQDPFQMVPTMEKEEMCQEVESSLLQLLHQQEATEQSYLHDMVSQPGMRGEKAVAPGHFPHTPAFHHCCVFLSHLGLLSWDKRNHLNILDKTSQLILELKNLDLLQAQSRATYKVAVLYVALGQEDKVSILSNSGGSQSYEEFVAGLGWEVNMETHAGYMAGMQREFASCSMPYYATSSEEVLFHVATRMASKMEQNSKVRHLGNDEVHIVWSEHWRDYRRSIFKTQFADVLIILYPLPSGLIRVQIDKKPSVPHFGPLFDGSVVDRMTVSSLVRATAINALRAQRNPLIGYRGRYEERLKYIQTITSNQLHSTFEDFCENVMHPMEMTSTQSMPAQRNSFSRSSPHKDAATPSLTNLLKSFALSSGSQYTPIVQSTPTTAATTFLKLDHTSPRRQRSSTNDERMTRSSEHRDQGRQFLRNSSVPDGLNDLTVSAPSGVSISAPTSRGILYPGPSPSPQSHNS